MSEFKIYFAGSIRGGRQKANDYKKIVECLEKYGDVLTKHVASTSLSKKGENISSNEIYERDLKWLKECDILFAETSIMSMGVGYEIGICEMLNKKVIIAYEKGITISGMIEGNSNLIHLPYNDIDELIKNIDKVMEEICI